MTQPPLYWLRRVENIVEAAKAIPLFGSPPPFPWNELESRLRELLASPSLQLLHQPCETIAQENPDLFFPHSRAFSFRLSPLQGHATLLFSSVSVEALSSLLLGKTQDLDPSFEEGFYAYLLLQISKTLQDLRAFADLQILWCEEPLPLEKESFLIDLVLKIEEREFPLRLVLSPSLVQGFASYFKKTTPTLSLEAAKALSLPLTVEAGSCLLTQQEWKSLKVGDFLILDRCTYNPDTQKGTALLTWKETPLLLVKARKNRIKIVEHAVYNAKANTMVNEDFPEEFLEEDIPLPDFEASPADQGEDLSAVEEVAEEKAPSLPAPKDTLSSIEEIPLLLTLEIGRLEMSLEKLLSLEPGNVLELGTYPEQGVTLSIHGKKVARGELMKVGDLLGVRILEIG